MAKRKEEDEELMTMEALVELAGVDVEDDDFPPIEDEETEEEEEESEEEESEEEEEESEEAEDDSDDSEEDYSEDEESTEEPKEDELSEDEQKAATFIGLWNDGIGEEISEDDLEEDEEFDLAKVVQKKIVKSATNMYNQAVSGLPAVEAEAVQFLMGGGSLEDFVEITKAEEFNYSEDDLEEDAGLQEKLIRKAYLASGVSEARVNRIVKSLEEDEMFEEAKVALSDLSKTKSKGAKRKTIEQRRKEATAKAQAAQEERTQMITATANKEFSTTKEFIPGKAIRKATQDALVAKMPKTISKIYANLDKYAAKLTFLDHYGLLDGDFSKVGEVGKSKATSDLKKLLKTKTKTRTAGKTKDATVFNHLKAAKSRYRK